MSEFQNVANLGASLLALWLVLIGVAMVLQRRDWAAAVARWPFEGAWWLLRQTVRLARRAVGGLLVAFGQAVRGGGNRNERPRH